MRPALTRYYYYGRGGGSEQATIPSPLMSWSKDTTSADLQWNNPGADNFILERATLSDYSDATQVYSGANTDFADSGLTIGTTYYYRVKAQKTGVSDSDWTTSSVTTIMAMPDFWYEFTGIFPYMSGSEVGNESENEYGSTTGVNVSTLKSVVNTSGKTLTNLGDPYTNRGALDHQDHTSPYGSLRPNNINYYIAPSDEVFSGDFTIAFRWKQTGTSQISNSYIVRHTINTGAYIRMSNASTIRIAFGSGGNEVTIDPLLNEKWYNIVIKRSGATLYVSTDGGLNYVSGVVMTDDLTVNGFFLGANNRYQRFVKYSGDQPIEVLNQVFSYLSQTAYNEAEPVSDIDVSGVTWQQHQGDYIVNTSFAKNVTAGITRDRVFNIGEYRVLFGNTKTGAPDLSNDFVIVEKRSTGEISDIKYLGITTDIEDPHHNGSGFIDDNKIKHLEMDSHYDYGPGSGGKPQSLVIKEFGNNFDLSAFITRKLANDVAAFTGSSLQYPQYHRFDATKKAVVFSHNFWLDGIGRRQTILLTQDNFNSFEKETLIDLGASNYWGYLTKIYSPDGKLRCIVNIINTNTNLYDYFCYVESEDGIVWKNITGDFAKDVSNNNSITLSELVANCLIQDAAELTGNARTCWAFYDSSDGEVHGICGDGSDTGLQMFYWDGTEWKFAPINAGDKTLVYDLVIGNSDNSPILIRKGPNAYDAYVHEENGGAWKIIRKTTTDKGVTWTNGEDFSSDPTSQHKRMHVNRDALYNDHITIAASRVVTSDNSDIFRKDVV